MTLKSTFLVSLFFFASISIAQANNLPITVVANESITITLFFPSEINKVIKPAVNYKFEYDRNGTMGTLVARKGAASNLTVITKDGSIFSFLLQYDQEVANFTYVLSIEQAIGRMESSGSTTNISTFDEKESDSVLENDTLGSLQREEPPLKMKNKKTVDKQKPRKEEPLGKSIRSNFNEKEAVVSDSFEKEEAALTAELASNSLYDTDRESYYDIYCENNFDRETRLNSDFTAGDGIELQLNALTADKNEFYFIFQVTNRLTTRFNAEALRFYVRSSPEDEPLHMTPVHIFNEQDSIDAGRTKKMVYVLNNFRLSKDQKVFVVLNEKDGPRNTIIKIDSRTINGVEEKLTSAAR